MVFFKKRLGFLIVALVSFVIVSFAWAVQDRGPETMNLKERFKVEGNKSATIFPHWMHQEALDKKCSNCHENEEGGGKLRFKLEKLTSVSNDFHRNFCWPCHMKMEVPNGKSCSTCHPR